MEYFFISGTIIFTVYGQLILKWRIGRYGALPVGFNEKFTFFLQLFTDLYILSGFVAAFIAALFWMAAMTRSDLSFAYPLITAGLTVITSSLAIIIFGESITFAKLFGILLIIFGILVMQYR